MANTTLQGIDRWRANAAGYASRPIHWLRARAVDPDRVRTLCMLLGPNRNLTTLTGAMAALHPGIQVLNNAGKRQLPLADKLLRSGDGAWARFVRVAVQRSLGGKRGVYGGSILLSHAFDDSHIADLYARRFGTAFLKNDLTCLFWKSALRLTTHVRREGLDLDDALDRNPRLRFVMPVRCPLDCALSNQRTGHYRQFPELQGANVLQITDFLVKLSAWGLELAERHPQSVLVFSEAELRDPDRRRSVLEALSRLLDLPLDERWVEDTQSLEMRKRRYDPDQDLRDACLSSIDRHLTRFPAVQADLASLV